MSWTDSFRFLCIILENVTAERYIFEKIRTFIYIMYVVKKTMCLPVIVNPLVMGFEHSL